MKTKKDSFRGRVLNVLKQYGESTALFVAEQLKVDRERVSRTLGETSNKGVVISKKEKGSPATYKLNPTVKVDLRTEKSYKIQASRAIENLSKLNPLFTAWVKNNTLEP